METVVAALVIPEYMSVRCPACANDVSQIDSERTVRFLGDTDRIPGPDALTVQPCGHPVRSFTVHAPNGTISRIEISL